MITGIIIGIIILWLIGISYFVWKMQSHYNGLIEGTNGRTLQAIMDNVLHDTREAKADILNLQKQTKLLHEDGELHIQKIGLLRFNPFKDTGGDQSFVLALLNNQSTGIVISGLYSRTGTRWYAKKIESGKGVDHELSSEEKKAIGTAEGK